MTRASSVFVLGVSALAFGAHCDGKTTDELLPLPDDEAEQHEAPRADGECRQLREEPDSWTTKLEAYDFEPRENLRLARDPCGNTVVAWGETRLDARIEHGLALGRVFRDGVVDWRTITFTGPSQVPHLTTDRFGNIVLLTEGSLQVSTPAGQQYPDMPPQGLGPGGFGLAQADGDFWIEANVTRLISLPSGQTVFASNDKVGHSNFGRHSFLAIESGAQIWSYLSQNLDFHSGQFYGTNLLVMMTGNEFGTVFHTELVGAANFAEAALLATNGKRTFLGSTYYVADPMTLERIECSESVLIDIDNENWKPDAPNFCGAIEAFALAGDSLFSLWSVPVASENPDQHPFEATPILLRHDLEGRETGRFELEDTIGRTHQDGTGALDMVVTNDGKTAIIGILSGGPWNGRYFTYPSSVTVAKVLLD